MLKDVEMGVNFYKEFGKLEKQLVKYQDKVSEIKKPNAERLKSNILKPKKDEKKI
ncbi:hypothetical protein [Clostridioides difficile]|uniref:hypothetical protein n=1 Tax=Clostridioides difficile TaxID=1496 RepID=UPI002FCF5594